jgi:hypothetical protein
MLPRLLRVGLVLGGFAAAACGLVGGKGRPQTPEASPPSHAGGHEPGPLPPLPVEKAQEEVVLAAWSEPPRLPAAGGQTQILVRLQKRGGAPYEGVQVRLRTSAGTLFSGGRILLSDASGRTRDRLTTHEPAFITVNAGGTVYRIRIPVGDGS